MKGPHGPDTFEAEADEAIQQLGMRSLIKLFTFLITDLRVA